MKKLLLILSLMMVLSVMVACSDDNPASNSDLDNLENVTTNETDQDTLELTLEELKAFDGQDGRPAYVAVDGVIYDMSNSNLWKNGQHNGFQAGQDLTDVIKNQSPHGVKNLERVPKIGVLVD